MTLGKKIVFLTVFVIIGTNLYAQESGLTFKPFFGGGGMTVVFDGTGYGLGGYGEFAFLFYENGLQISNHLIGIGESINGASGNDYGRGSIIDKISFGGLLENNKLRTYAFIEGGVGFGSRNEMADINIIWGGGGGIDFFFHKNGSIYLESGYLQHHSDNMLFGGGSISIGTRGYF
ncbi:hypothetical protein FACS189444_1940 [Spirochaetia bacterium]|nr:hypothetical protein FACS189444_1940 [Spirochaetia bacterium]